MDERTCRLLAAMPPSNWSKAIVRLATVRRYLEGEDRSAMAVDRHAAAIGVGRSLFYRLAQIYSASSQNEAPRRHKSSVIDPGTEAAVQNAIADLGASAPLAVVLERARALCREQGVPLATSQIVRTRHGRSGAGAAIAQRVRLATDFAFDRSAMELAVPGPAGEPTRLVLSCIVDMRNGTLTAHILTAGDPAATDLAAMFLAWPDPTGTIFVPEAERSAHGVDLAVLARDRGVVPLIHDRRRPGTFIRAALGSRVGRIELVERRPKPEAVHVDLETARRVVDHLILRQTTVE